MRHILLLVLGFYFPSFLQAQIIQTEPGHFEGNNVHQKDIDSLFKMTTDVTWLAISYSDSTLVLPAFQKLNILGINAVSLRQLRLSGALPELELLDLNSPYLTKFEEKPLPQLYQLTLNAQLDSIPNFVCKSPELSLVDISINKVIEIQDCVDQRFADNTFKLSKLELLDQVGGKHIYGMESHSEEEEVAVDDFFNDGDWELTFEKENRRIKLIQVGLRVALVGVILLITYVF
jgi:hypothetical protein